MLKVNFFSVAEWIQVTFPIARIVIISLMALLSISLVIVIMLQPGNSGNVSAISGNTDTFFNKNKEKTLEGFLKRLTIIFSICLFVLSLLFFLSLIPYAAGIGQ